MRMKKRSRASVIPFGIAGPILDHWEAMLQASHAKSGVDKEDNEGTGS
jgi:hypothetical protein